MRNRLVKLLLLFFLSLTVSSCSFDKNVSPTTPSSPSASTPNGPSPADGAQNQFLYITLKWQCENAIEFDVFISEASPPLIKYVTVTTNSYTTSLLKYNTTYYWRVIAKLSDGTQSLGPVWSFSTVPSTVSANGYALILNNIGTSLPHNVQATYQVVDLNGSGVTSMTQSEFEVLEDYQPLSVTESQLTIAHHPTIYNQIRTVLLLDNSTSVISDSNKIKTSARVIVNGVRPNQEIAIFQFSDKITMLQDFTNDVNLLLNAINTKYTSGVSTTDFYGAVVYGASLWKDDSSINKIFQGCMVIVSDGNDTRGSTSLASAMSAIHNKLVYTVGLGNEIQPDILNGIGTGGSFLIGQENEITSRFSNLETSLTATANSFYDLGYKSPKRGNITHSLQIKIINNPYTGEQSNIVAYFSSAGFY